MLQRSAGSGTYKNFLRVISLVNGFAKNKSRINHTTMLTGKALPAMYGDAGIL